MYGGGGGEGVDFNKKKFGPPTIQVRDGLEITEMPRTKPAAHIVRYNSMNTDSSTSTISIDAWACSKLESGGGFVDFLGHGRVARL